MLTLAMDTASAACQACVHDEAGRVLAVGCEIIGRGHAERLMPVLDGALEAAAVDLSAIGRIVVTIGPGSFTGIRVGVSVARGLALALGRPCIGVGSLQALAASAGGQGPVLAVVDAKRGEVYAALFDADLQPVAAPAAMTPAEAAELAERADARLTGSGAPLVEAHLPKRAEAGRVVSVSDTVDMGALARLVAAGHGPFAPPKPLYLRGADAKPQQGFAVARRA